MLEGPSNLLSRPEVWLAFVALGGFLAIYAVLRGSLPGTRPGPEDESQAPTPVHRERSLLLLAIGLGLVLAGGLLAPTYGIPWSIPPFLAGVGLVVWQNQANRPYRHCSPVLRRATDLSHLFLNTALLAGILVVANVAAFRYGGRGI
ncbi:MAG: ABC transporter, partial [Isosphaeraceae bacterium]